MKRILTWSPLTVSLITFAPAEAQQPGKLYRIGYLMVGFPSGSAPLLGAFRQGMRELGYIEQKNFVVEPRWSEGKNDRLPALAAELVQLNVDVIVAAPTPPALAAQQATRTMPIVVAHMSDHVEAGLVTSLARPGGNVTGMRSLQAELAGKRLELLKEAFPNVSRVAVFGGRGPSPGERRQMREMESAAQTLELNVQIVYANADFESLISTITGIRASGFTLISSPGQLDFLNQILGVPAKIRLPAIYPDRTYVEAGGLMSLVPKQKSFTGVLHTTLTKF
jgi:putative ABC transport system substrate-binding protein